MPMFFQKRHGESPEFLSGESPFGYFAERSSTEAKTIRSFSSNRRTQGAAQQPQIKYLSL